MVDSNPKLAIAKSVSETQRNQRGAIRKEAVRRGSTRLQQLGEKREIDGARVGVFDEMSAALYPRSADLAQAHRVKSQVEISCFYDGEGPRKPTTPRSPAFLKGLSARGIVRRYGTWLNQIAKQRKLTPQ